jgi:hypothetical protein
MDCPSCGGERLAFPVPADLGAYLPDDRPAATVCTRCLTVVPADEAPAELPDFRAVSDALPRDREAAAALVLALGLLDALAVHRAEIDALLATVERAGVDPLLAMDRLAADPGLAPGPDLERRRAQLEQLLS